MQSRDTSAAGVTGAMDKTTGTIAIGITGYALEQQSQQKILVMGTSASLSLLPSCRDVEAAKQERMRNFKR